MMTHNPKDMAAIAWDTVERVNQELPSCAGYQRIKDETIAALEDVFRSYLHAKHNGPPHTPKPPGTYPNPTMNGGNSDRVLQRD